MRITIIILLIIALVACDTDNNNPNPAEHFFLHYYGSDGNQTGADMVNNGDGTFTLLGTSTLGSHGSIYLLKIDEHGKVLWESTLGTLYSESAKDIEQTNDGNYVTLSNAMNDTTGIDIIIRTINASDGSQINIGVFSYDTLSDEIGETVTQIFDGTQPAGFIVAGSTNYDSSSLNSDGFEGQTAIFARFDTQCAKYAGTWSENIGASGDDYAVKIVQKDNNLNAAYPFHLFGYSNSFRYPSKISFNFWSTNINAFGGGESFEEGLVLGSPDQTDEFLTCVANKGGINYLLAGYTHVSNQNKIFIASSGSDIIPPMTIDAVDLGILTDPIYTTVKAYHTLRGSYLLLATSKTTDTNLLLTKINNDGSLAWTQPQLFGGSGNDYANAVMELPDERILVMGTVQLGNEKQLKIMLMKLNKDGRFEN